MEPWVSELAASGSCQQGTQYSELHFGGEMREGKVLVDSHTGRQCERFPPGVQGSFHSITASGTPERGWGSLGWFSRPTRTQTSYAGVLTWNSNQRNTSANWKSQCRWFLLLKPRLENGCPPTPLTLPPTFRSIPLCPVKVKTRFVLKRLRNAHA